MLVAQGNDVVVLRRRQVLQATTLQHFERLEADLDGLEAVPILVAGRQDDAILALIVSVPEDAVMHRGSLETDFIDRLDDRDSDGLVTEGNSEEALLLLLVRSLRLPRDVDVLDGLSSLLLPLAPSLCLHMGFHEAFRTEIVRTVSVKAEVRQIIDVVQPKAGILNLVAVPGADAHLAKMVFEFPTACAAEEVPDDFKLAGLHELLKGIVRQQLDGKRSDVDVRRETFDDIGVQLRLLRHMY